MDRIDNSRAPRHKISRPQAQVYNPAAASTPLAALLSALSSVAQSNCSKPRSLGQGPNEAHFTAQLCSALSLQPDSLFSNFRRNRPAQDASQAQASLPAAKHSAFQPQPSLKGEDGTADHSSGVACNSRETHCQQVECEAEVEPATQDTSSNGEGSADLLHKLKAEPLSDEAKKRRRQEINRESARRVRRRKSLEFQQLNLKVASLQAAAVSAAADHAAIVRYATELTKERDALLQRGTDLEAKWIAAECRNLVLRQQIANQKGVLLEDVAADTGQLVVKSPKSDQEGQ